VSLRSRARRTFAAAAALMFVAALVLTGWHRASELHGRCLEHGEELHIVHVAGGAPVVSDALVAQVSSSGWALQDGDDHCEILAAARHTPTTEGAQTHTVTIASITIAALASVAATAPASAALFRLAPKTSPPANA
jgi:hypothetical protein